MKLLEIADYPFNHVRLKWHGPFLWARGSGAFRNADEQLMNKPGVYRAETSYSERRMLKYIGSASDCFRSRLTGQHRIYQELVQEKKRRVNMYLGTLHPERRLKLKQSSYIEIEYILQQVHRNDLISWHGLKYLPKIQRGQGWRITNMGKRGEPSRVIAYPAFAVAGQDR